LELRASPGSPANCCRREPIDDVDWRRSSSIPSFKIIFRTLRSFRDTHLSLGWLQLLVNRWNSGKGPSVTERDREEERGTEVELGFGGGVGLLIGHRERRRESWRGAMAVLATPSCFGWSRGGRRWSPQWVPPVSSYRTGKLAGPQVGWLAGPRWMGFGQVSFFPLFFPVSILFLFLLFFCFGILIWIPICFAGFWIWNLL
jgi:hypothetical protein